MAGLAIERSSSPLASEGVVSVTFICMSVKRTCKSSRFRTKPVASVSLIVPLENVTV